MDRPNIHPAAWVAPGAFVRGDVTIGEQSNIWYNAVLRGDQEKITVGKATTIQDCCVLHGDAGCDVVVGDYVTVGHGAVLHGCTVEDNCLIGMNAVVLDHAGFGFETVGSTTSRPCPGNAKPWFHRLPEYDSMMVHVGLANIGSDKVIERAEKAWTQARQMQLSVSIARTNDDQCGDLDEGIEDYCISMRRAAGRTAMVEVNVSCPNTHVGEPFTATPEALDRLFTALDKIDRPQPTLVKMPLNKPWGEYKELLDVLAEHNVQGLSIANLQKDRTGLEIPRDWEGGLSGGPCTNASTELIRKVYKEYGDRFAIAGIGGVFTPEQAYAKIRSGSSLVMFISSLMYRGPQQITVLKRGLAQLLRRDGFEHVSDAVGVDVE